MHTKHIENACYPSVQCNVITQPDAMLYACMFLQSVFVHIMRLLCRVGTSTIITSVTFAIVTVTHSSESFRLSKPFS